MTRRELADWLYADDPNGGPENTFAVCPLITGWQSYRE